jgi:hypothetical protein
MMTIKHLCTGSSSSEHIQLHSVNKEIVVLLPVILLLALRHGRNTIFLSQIASDESQRGAGLICSVILCLMIRNEVGKSA